jgi:hypothetical protein
MSHDVFSADFNLTEQRRLKRKSNQFLSARPMSRRSLAN